MRRHQLLGDRGGDRLEHDREAAGLLQGERLGGDPCAAAGGAPLRLPATERGRGLRASGRRGPSRGCRRPTIARARLTDASPPPSSLTASQPASLTMRTARRDRLLVGDLIGAERQVADQAAACAGRGARRAASTSMSSSSTGVVSVVAEHGRRGGVADEHQVDAGRLGGASARVVVGGDHHDRLAEALLLRQQRQRHRQAPGVGGTDLRGCGRGGGWTWCCSSLTRLTLASLTQASRVATSSSTVMMRLVCAST